MKIIYHIQNIKKPSIYGENRNFRIDTGLCVLVQVTGLEPVPKVRFFGLDKPFCSACGKNVARIIY